MANRSRFVKDVPITGVPKSPQTIAYSTLRDTDGNYLPGTFSSAPIVSPISPDQDLDFYLPSDPTTTSFTIARTKIGIYGLGIPTCHIEFYGDSDFKSVGMNLLDMIGMWRIYVDDLKKKDFKSNLIVQMLKDGQNEIMKRIYPHILREVEVNLTSQDLNSDGGFDISGLSQTIYNNDFGIVSVRIKGGEFCDKISHEEYIRVINENRYFSGDDPKYYAKEKYIYIEPYTSGETQIDLKYRRKPTNMILYANSSNNVNCEFEEHIQRIILGLSVEPFIDKVPQARRVYERALIDIDNLNNGCSDTDTNERDIDIFSRDTEREYPIKVTPYTV